MHSPQDAACGSRLEPTERDPLLPSSTNSNIRVRRKSPAQNSSHMNYNQDNNLSPVGHPTNARGGSGIVHDRASSFMPPSQPAPRVNPRESGNTIPENTDSSQDFDDRTFDSGEPTVDYSINHTQDEIFAIRRAALSAFIPLTYAWVSKTEISNMKHSENDEISFIFVCQSHDCLIQFFVYLIFFH